MARKKLAQKIPAGWRIHHTWDSELRKLNIEAIGCMIVSDEPPDDDDVWEEAWGWEFNTETFTEFSGNQYKTKEKAIIAAEKWLVKYIRRQQKKLDKALSSCRNV